MCRGCRARTLVYEKCSKDLTKQLLNIYNIYTLQIHHITSQYERGKDNG